MNDGPATLYDILNKTSDEKRAIVETIAKEFYGINWDGQSAIEVKTLDDYKNFIFTYLVYIDVSKEIISSLCNNQTSFIEYFMFLHIMNTTHNEFFIKYAGPKHTVNEWKTRFTNALGNDITYFISSNDCDLVHNVVNDITVLNEFVSYFSIDGKVFADNMLSYVMNDKEDVRKYTQAMAKFMYDDCEMNCDNIDDFFKNVELWFMSHSQTLDAIIESLDKTKLEQYFANSKQITCFLTILCFIVAIFIERCQIPDMQIVDNQ